ncbi:MAG TPA: hypothetical protein VE377_09160 [Candidatus Dormibacteraeota bacterium]|nr:hypothetical protein [Candidatus Dormibacteraeota bacterium]
MKSTAERHQPACMVAHHVISKLGAIIGFCDLLIETTEEGTEQARRLGMIREIAETTVKDMVEHQRQVEAETQDTEKRKAG